MFRKKTHDFLATEPLLGWKSTYVRDDLRTGKQGIYLK